MFNVGAGEMFAIMLLALIILGPERLPKAMGQVGRAVGQLRRISSGFQDEVRRAMDPDDAPFRPGEERLPTPPPALDDEVKVVHSGVDPDPASPPTPPPADAEVEVEVDEAARDEVGEPDPGADRAEDEDEDEDGQGPDLRAIG